MPVIEVVEDAGVMAPSMDGAAGATEQGVHTSEDRPAPRGVRFFPPRTDSGQHRAEAPVAGAVTVAPLTGEGST